MTTKNVLTPTGSKYNFANAIDMHLTVWEGNGQSTVYADTVEKIASSTVLVNGQFATSNSGQITQVFRIDNLTSASTTGWLVVTGPGGGSVPTLVGGGLTPGPRGS